MRFFTQKSSFIICFLLTLLAFESKAVVEPYSKSIKGKIRKDTLIEVGDDKFLDPAFNWSSVSNRSVKNNITLSIINDSLLTRDFKCAVQLKVLYYKTRGQEIPDTIRSVRLNVNYTAVKGKNYRISDSYTFEGAYHIKILVDSVNSDAFGTNMPPVLQLTGNIVIDRQYKFVKEYPLNSDVSLFQNGLKVNNASIRNSLASSADSIVNQLKIQWDFVPGAEEYDLEWATLDKGSRFDSLMNKLIANTEVYTWEIDNVFKNNSSRAATSGNSYLLSLLYNADFLLYRIRQVQYDSLGIRQAGNWQYRQRNGEYAAWAVKWHLPKLNWQSSATFAEDGKKKEVINYFDGSLRGRQTVTLSNSDNVAVVQENIYDEFGRVTANVLPAPVKADSLKTPYLHYFKNFNLNSSAVPYNYLNVAGQDALCGFNTDSLSSLSGAANYYSSRNKFRSLKPYNNYIPDAEGFPLSVTQYTPDNTGRIRVQGGVGKRFQPTNDVSGKTTRYFYGKPEQWELDRLFGNDVGYASHYLKNVVVDPNDQISISYLNASGKTIATALSGAAPVGMDALTNAPNASVESINLLNYRNFDFKGSELELSAKTTYLATVKGSTGTFSYSIPKLISTYPDSNTFKPCSNCYYDLHVVVTNDCNEPLYSTTSAIQIGSRNSDCNDSGVESRSFSVVFDKVGEYFISFRFALNRDVIDNYTDEFISKGLTAEALKTRPKFILENLIKTDFSGLFSDCKTCLDMLGDTTHFKTEMTERYHQLEVDSTVVTRADYSAWLGSLYTVLKGRCDSMQSSCTNNPCQEYERLMLEDVSPGGQYSLFDKDGNALEAEINVLHRFWSVIFPPADPTSTTYRAELIVDEDGSETSPYARDFYPQKMIKYWKDEWALKFLKYHPEYCKLEFCNSTANNLRWNEKLNETDVAEYIAERSGTQGLEYQSNAEWLLDADPFFKQGMPGFTDYTYIKEDLQNYTHKVLKFTSQPVKGISSFVDYMLYCADPKWKTTATGQNTWSSCAPDTSCRVVDREWQYYRDIYFEVKDAYYKKARDRYCGSICPVGSPFVYSTTKKISTYDFAIAEISGGNCSSIEKRYKVEYLPGNLTKVVKVSIYYPGQGAAVVIDFNDGASEKEICLPNKVPAKGVLISGVTIMN